MRLIDADELKKALGITSKDCSKCDWGSYESCGRGKEFEDICIAIDNTDSIDAIPINWINLFNSTPIGGDSIDDMVREWRYKQEIEAERERDEDRNEADQR